MNEEKEARRARVREGINGIIDLVWSGLLWIFCSLPVFTIGASTTALYYTVVKCIRHDRGRVTPVFFGAFRANFKTATLVWLLYLLYLAVGTADAWAWGLMGAGEGGVIYYFSRLFFLPPILTFPWTFAYISRFQNGVKGSLKYAAWLTLRNFGKTLLLALELGAAVLAVWLIPAIGLILPGAVAMLMSTHIEPVFRPLTQDAKGHGIDDWYNE